MSDSSSDQKPLVVGMATAGILLDSGPDYLYKLIKAQELDSYLDGNRRKITLASIERHIEKRLAAEPTQLIRSDEMSAIRKLGRHHGRLSKPAA